MMLLTYFSHLKKPTNYSFLLRNRYFLGLDLLILFCTPALALILRVDSMDVLIMYAPALLLYTQLTVALRLLVYHFSDMYRRYWRYASVAEVLQIVSAVSVSNLIIIGLFFVFHIISMTFWQLPAGTILPRSIPLIDSLLVLVWVCASRLSIRLIYHRRRRQPKGDVTHVAIMGAGEAGLMFLREIKNNPHLGLVPVAFLDDDPHKRGMNIHGLRVHGDHTDLPHVIRNYGIDQVLIAMPTASGKAVREIVTICERAGVETKTIPAIHELLGGRLKVSNIRDVEIADLLRRTPIQTDRSAVDELLSDASVLVTGGGGSIGSELCRQILRSRPTKVIILGHGENSVFEIHQELNRLNVESGGQTTLETVIADIRIPERVHHILKQYRPQVVFHAAAHKHVPLMELNPTEAIDNNVLGTRNLLAAALAVDVERFVMISSDKAVNPTNIMGASKRAAELLVHQAAKQSGRPYVAVRFGNVLGSRGSVVLTFKKQIAMGGPVTVTHPDMVRYFMTIPEAVQLVLQASVLSKGGEVFKFTIYRK